jgi:hypothetical protein
MRRLAEVGLSSSRELNEIQPIESVPRTPYANAKDKAAAVELDSRSPSQTND